MNKFYGVFNKVFPWILVITFILVIFMVAAQFAIVVFGGMAFWELGVEGIGELIGTFLKSVQHGMNT